MTSYNKGGCHGHLSIIYRKISDLKPFARNARTHSRKQVNHIAGSIGEFGFTNPVLVDENGQIIAGHGRVQAAKQLGLTEIPTIQIGHLSRTQKRALRLADNRLAEKAGWDLEILAVELQDLSADGFEIAITGFDPPEVDCILDNAANTKTDGVITAANVRSLRPHRTPVRYIIAGPDSITIACSPNSFIASWTLAILAR